MEWLRKNSSKIVLFVGMFLIARAGWNIFHAALIQGVFDLVMGFYLVQDYRISELSEIVNALAEREIIRIKKELLKGKDSDV